MEIKFATYNSIDPVDWDLDYNSRNPDVFSPLYIPKPISAKTETKIADPEITKDIKILKNINPISTDKTPTIKEEVKSGHKKITTAYNSIPKSERYKSFSKYYDEVEQEVPEAKNYRKFLTKIAQAESGFDHTIQNKAGAPAFGYFQFMQGSAKGRSYNNIKTYSGLDVDTFRNDPKSQIKAAIKLAQNFEKSFSSKDLELAKNKGYSLNGLLAGAWLGGNKGVSKYLNGLVDASDKHWSSENKGTTVGTRMREFNFKLGGTINKKPGL